MLLSSIAHCDAALQIVAPPPIIVIKGEMISTIVECPKGKETPEVEALICFIINTECSCQHDSLRQGTS